jgi:hypothetical protein
MAGRAAHYHPGEVGTAAVAIKFALRSVRDVLAQCMTLILPLGYNIRSLSGSN